MTKTQTASSSNPVETCAPNNDATFMNGRELDWNVLKGQIGLGNVMSISGGRALRINESTITMQVGRGYSVIVHLAADDTYTVRRHYCRKQKGVRKNWDKGTMTGIYATDIGDCAYFASCFINVDFPLFADGEDGSQS